MSHFDVTNWTTLLAALSTLAIALLRSPRMTEAQTMGLLGVVLGIAFFLGRSLDGALSWPLDPSLAVAFWIALMTQQATYQVIKKQPWFQRLEGETNTP